MAPKTRFESHSPEEVAQIAAYVKDLGIGWWEARVVVSAGYSTVEEVAYVSRHELAKQSGLSNKRVQSLQLAAQRRLLDQEMASEGM